MKKDLFFSHSKEDESKAKPIEFHRTTLSLYSKSIGSISFNPLLSAISMNFSISSLLKILSGVP